MTFEEVLDQAMAMLQRRGRLTYRTLQLHFHLDDEHFEALKDELIYGQRLAVDEDGRVLVWTGGTDVPPGTSPPGPQPAPPSAPQAATAPAVPSPADAEHRQLTVLFCDLVDSTRLASQLDPEDWREVVRAYQQTCAAVIERFEGHIAQYLGDGLLDYFGYPRAHEDDAQRAVPTGLTMVQAVATLNRRLEPGQGVRLAVRVGIHTGLVVVGEVGGGSRQEQLALGETPNLAARLQGLAAPDTVVVSPATFHLVRGYFTAQALGAHRLSLTGGKALPAAVVEQVVAKTDEVPLFVEELVKMLLESGLVREEGDHYVLTDHLPPLTIPSTLHDALMAQLDRLATGKEVAQLGVMLGRTFAYALLQAHCHLGLGTLYRQMGRGEEARAALSTAIELYRAMDMTFWLPQAEAVLAQVGGVE